MTVKVAEGTIPRCLADPVLFTPIPALFISSEPIKTQRCPVINIQISAKSIREILASAETMQTKNGAICSLIRGVPLSEFIQIVDQVKKSEGRSAIITLYHLWIECNSDISPHIYGAWFNIGVEFSCTEDNENAIISYKNALCIKPDLYQAAINLGLRYESTGQTDLALETWKSALQPDEARTGLLNHLGRVSENLKRYDQATAALSASLLTTPQQPDVIHHWIYLRQKMCRWPVYPTSIPGLSVKEMRSATGALSGLAITDDIQNQTQHARDWLRRKGPGPSSRLSPTTGYNHDRIRLGYLSSDYCAHPISYLVAQLFERHDRICFEVYGYCNTKDDGSDTRKRIVASFDKFMSIRAMSDEQAARAIRDDEIDILIDLNGLTQGTRLFILRSCPAPVQVTYLGYIGSLPLPELDYLLCDEFVIPRDKASEYQPEPLYLPGCFQVNDTLLPVGRTPTRIEIGLPEKSFVFCCFSNNYKITEQVFDAWMEILRRTQNSVLWLLADNHWAGCNLRDNALKHGIDPNRLIFAERVSLSDYLGRLRLADIFLDTFPYNAGTTASDALRMGVPLITLSGNSYVSRMAGSLLLTIGFKAGIASTLAEYVEKAVELASDPVKYRTARDTVGGGAWRRTIGNIELFVPQLEAAYRSIAKRSSHGGLCKV